jgi:hypothetical protein
MYQLIILFAVTTSAGVGVSTEKLAMPNEEACLKAAEKAKNDAPFVVSKAICVRTAS